MGWGASDCFSCFSYFSCILDSSACESEDASAAEVKVATEGKGGCWDAWMLGCLDARMLGC